MRHNGKKALNKVYSKCRKEERIQALLKAIPNLLYIECRIYLRK